MAIRKFKQITRLLEELDKKLEKKTRISTIGGAVMLYHELKPATKDMGLRKT